MLCEDFQIFTSILISINRQTECQESGKSVQTLTLQKKNQDGVKINGKTCGLRQAVSGWMVVNVIILIFVLPCSENVDKLFKQVIKLCSITLCTGQDAEVLRIIISTQ